MLRVVDGADDAGTLQLSKGGAREGEPEGDQTSGPSDEPSAHGAFAPLTVDLLTWNHLRGTETALMLQHRSAGTVGPVLSMSASGLRRSPEEIIEGGSGE